MQDRRRERFFFLLLVLLVVVTIAVILWKAKELGWSDSTAGAPVGTDQALAAAFFSFL